MKRGQFTEEQIIGILKEVEAGQKVGEVCRKYGVSEATYYRWKNVYSGLEVSQMRRLRQLEEENRRLKQIVADLTLDNTMLKEITAKNGNACPGTGDGRSPHPYVPSVSAAGVSRRWCQSGDCAVSFAPASNERPAVSAHRHASAGTGRSAAPLWLSSLRSLAAPRRLPGQP